MNEKDRVAHLQQKIWEGSIPLCIKLSPDECRTYNDSFTYMVLLVFPQPWPSRSMIDY